MHFKQIHISPSSRGIVDHFFCFICDEYVWDCDHLIEERLSDPRITALGGSQLQSFAYDGKSRTLAIEFRVTAPFVHNEVPLPPPPRVVQYLGVPRYIFTKLIRFKIGRRQEQYWADAIRTRYGCQTVRTLCRLPRTLRFSEARNIRFHTFEDYMLRVSSEERENFRLAVAAMRLLLLRTLAPRRVAGLGGLIECQCCGSVASRINDLRHRNCLWFQVQ